MFLKNIANIEKIFHFFRWMETFHCFYQLSDHKVALWGGEGVGGEVGG